MKYTVEQRITENRCDECEKVMIGDGNDLGGPTVCDHCYGLIPRPGYDYPTTDEVMRGGQARGQGFDPFE